MSIKRRIVASGPVRTTVAATVTGIGAGGRNRYEVEEQFSIYANGRYSENHVRIMSTKGSRAIRFGPSFIRMPNDRSFFNAARGYFGSWGRQNNIVQEIGQGAIFPIDMASLRSTESERHIVLQTTSGNN